MDGSEQASMESRLDEQTGRHSSTTSSPSHESVTMDAVTMGTVTMDTDAIERLEQLNTKEQLKEAFSLLVEVVCSLLSLLVQSTQRACRHVSAKVHTLPVVGSLTRKLWLVFAILVRKICPDSRSKRKSLLAYMAGFILGSFFYVSLLNISYAMNYEGQKIKMQNDALRKEATTRPYDRTTQPFPQWMPTTQWPRTNSGVEWETRRNTRLSFEELSKTKALMERHLPVGERGGTLLPIPKIMHQSWHIKLVPQKFSPWMSSWRQNHPKWRHLFWTGKGGNRMVERNYPDYLSLYTNYSSELHRYKVNRYFILHHLGGVFTDLDMESLKPLDSLLSNYSCVLTEQPLAHQAVLYQQQSPNYVVNSFMACAPGHPFLKFILDMLDTYQPYDSSIEPERERVEKSVGALFLGDVLELYKVAFNRTVAEQVHILPSDWMMPNYDQKHLRVLAERCQTGQAQGSLIPAARQVCNKLLTTDFSSSPGPNAFNLCHWVDLYDEKTRFDIASGPVIEVEKIKA